MELLWSIRIFIYLTDFNWAAMMCQVPGENTEEDLALKTFLSRGDIL